MLKRITVNWNKVELKQYYKGKTKIKIKIKLIINI